MRGFDAGQPDGMFGPQTEIAVKQAQSAYGLTPDGIVGADTWERLGFTFR
ncbi:MAG: peptidoglycan-binding protein [Limnothrix sp. CACIAM 69d]|jgi:peptidoglycan hydrolase-like protein with peptidoglycan-binding domain|nr:peptidoglycan-binding protein [Limnothrix sp. FACHB-1083]MBD2190944.1 peptidoglycan-binding protein [Limnothrix sp. FACHB-1088]MBD2552392.1 peptidoglycan-binding protein [Limnothrix sp. FACHB-708]MBD2590258.1 peptidoglycan-binding protein [Limnothrix sp. FACHB-406]MBD2634034.1 peptidoglycan-binding protein [Limnothrix sp. FACHB-881]RFP63060.1 MAG: peptidoglycan-binding protein [Limnothrix sp. CACIAM 69d]